MKRILVNGAGGFIGGHMVKRLKSEGHWVRGVDIKHHEFTTPPADDFILGDLCDQQVAADAVDGIDEIYQFAADMGGAGYLFTGEHDADVMRNSATINLNTLHFGLKAGVRKFFYSSSACIYPAYNQTDPLNPKCSEDSAYPRSRTVSTAGRSSSASGYTCRICETMGRLSELRVSIISSVRKARGPAAKRKRLLHSAAKSPRSKMVARLRYGATENKPALSCISTSALMSSADLWSRISPVP